jgi:hypothetical protein
MTWEGITALASAATVIVLSATVLVAVRQLRAAAAQMEHSRRATQLDGMMRIFATFESETFRRSIDYIVNELDARVAEPDFASLLRIGQQAHQPWRPALSKLEEVGVYLRNGYLDSGPFFNNRANLILVWWEHLRPVVELQRLVVDNPYLWKDTQWMAEQAYQYAVRWVAEHPMPRPSTGEPFRVEFLSR